MRADICDLERAGAVRVVDDENAVARFVDSRFDVGRRDRVDAVDHVADRLRFVARRI